MGCFGDSEETGKKTTTNSLPSYLENAAQANVTKATSLLNKPFTAYTGAGTAPLADNERDAFGLIKSIAGSSNPYLSDIESLYKQFTSAPASSVSPASVIGGGTDIRSSTIQDYMNPYIAAALQPQLEDISRQGDATRKTLDAQSTMDGAFGDARSGVERAEQRRNEAILRTNTVGKGYNDAFNTAANLRSTDVGRLLDADKTNASLNETMLQRLITGGKAMNDLDASTVSRGLTTADALAKAGATERQLKMSEFLREQGWDAQQIAAVTAALSGTPRSQTQVSTEEQPNNSGFGFLGSIAGSVAPMLAKAIISDRRYKHKISVIGATLDGLPIYRFKYVGSEVWQIGLMAQDVEETYPTAVTEFNGVKMVEYGLATQAAAEMGASV